MIVFSRAVREALVDRARRAAPAECCGVLAGTFDPEESRVRAQHPVPNVADNPRTRYRLDDETLLAVLEDLEGREQEAVGFYHSHPRGPREPSEVDAERATWPDRSYVIVSLDPTVTVSSWRYRPGRGFERERIVVER